MAAASVVAGKLLLLVMIVLLHFPRLSGEVLHGVSKMHLAADVLLEAAHLLASS